MVTDHSEVRSLFDEPPGPHAHAGDPWTSHAAAKPPRAGSQAYKLLVAYGWAPAGLTDDEAAARARLGGYPRRRCSDLRRLGFIAWDGSTTRPSSYGKEQMVCRITETGRAALK
jgi:hypothetical protein